jgi:peptide/nickel transport system ATP-binding protein
VHPDDPPGKSTLLRLLVGLVRPKSGEAALDGTPVAGRGRRSERLLRRSVQLVQQDPYLSLNARQSIRTILGQPLAVHRGVRGSAATAACVGLLEEVGLDRDMLARTPDAFSGGLRQRIAIARALSVEPTYLLLDEPLSALDPDAARSVLALLAQIAAHRSLALLFVSHDLEPVRRVTDRVLVMRDGRVVEEGRTADVLSSPAHLYTRELIAAE